MQCLSEKPLPLSWTAPDDDGGCKIGNYVVEYFRQGWNVWLKAITTRQLSTTLNDLIEGSEYKFRVKAENPYGLSDPSSESDTVNIPGPKRTDLGPESINPEPKPILKPRSPKQSTLGLQMPDNMSTKSNSSEKMNRSPRTPTSVHFIPKIYESENIDNVMSYGTAFSPNSSGEKRSMHERPSSTDIVNKPPPVTKVFNDKPIEVLESNHVSPKREVRPEIPTDKIVLEPPQIDPADLHNSSEYMLVLCPDREKENKKSE